LLYGFSLNDNRDDVFIDVGNQNNATIEDYKKIKLLAENELDTLGFTERSTKKIEIYLAFDKLNSEKSISKSLEELDHKDNFYNR